MFKVYENLKIQSFESEFGKIEVAVINNEPFIKINTDITSALKFEEIFGEFNNGKDYMVAVCSDGYLIYVSEDDVIGSEEEKVIFGRKQKVGDYLVSEKGLNQLIRKSSDDREFWLPLMRYFNVELLPKFRPIKIEKGE